MFCRDFRHQIETNEAALSASLETARERFFSNLSILQLQLPELAQQLRELKPSRYTLAVDRAGVGNCIDTEHLSMHWPPAAFRRNYCLAPDDSENLGKLALIAAELEDDGNKLVPYLAEQTAPYILLYVRSLELFYASLHFTDWLPVLQSKTLLVQLSGTLTPTDHHSTTKQLINDLSTLASHGIATKPYQVIQPQADISSTEQVWHFEQSLLYNHDCDPVLRRHTHKFQWQPEFRLQNILIDTARKRPMRLPTKAWTLILCGANQAVFDSAAQLPSLERVILLDSLPIADELLAIFKQHSIEVHLCIGPVKDTASNFVNLLNQLPVETAWYCRLYQAGLNADALQFRQRVELELRYRVQPAMGIRRSLAAAVQLSAGPQHMLTRRTPWPHHQGHKLPLLLLGNGPSLGKTIKAIQQGKAKGYLLVSCGTTLSTLYSHNVTPHFHLELELATNAFNDIDKDYLAKVHLIAPLGFHYQWRTHFGAHSSFITDSYPIDKLVPGLPDDTIRVSDAFPTVLNLGVSLAGQLGAEEVWLAGFDLAFEDIHSSHAHGSVYAQRDPNHYILSSGELIEVTTIDGRSALTKREFQLAAFQTQDIISRLPKVTMHQLCAGLDLGANYREHLETLTFPTVSFNSLAANNSCSKVIIDWHTILHAYRAAPYLELFSTSAKRESAAQQYHLLLQRPFLTLEQARRKRAPAEFWTESLQRNLAALLLRLELNALTELPSAHELFTAMLEDFSLHEANI